MGTQTLILIVIDIVVLIILGMVLNKTLKLASKNKLEALEREAQLSLENGKREAEAAKKEAILEAK